MRKLTDQDLAALNVNGILNRDVENYVEMLTQESWTNVWNNPEGGEITDEGDDIILTDVKPEGVSEPLLFLMVEERKGGGWRAHIEIGDRLGSFTSPWETTRSGAEAWLTSGRLIGCAIYGVKSVLDVHVGFGLSPLVAAPEMITLILERAAGAIPLGESNMRLKKDLLDLASKIRDRDAGPQRFDTGLILAQHETDVLDDVLERVVAFLGRTGATALRQEVIDARRIVRPAST